MKEEWLFPGAVVPVDVETTSALVAEIKRLIDVVGGMALTQRPWVGLAEPEQEPVGQLQEAAYGRGQILWFKKPADTSMLYVAPPRKEWVGLTGTEINHIFAANVGYPERMMKEVEAKLREKNNGR